MSAPTQTRITDQILVTHDTAADRVQTLNIDTFGLPMDVHGVRLRVHLNDTLLYENPPAPDDAGEPSSHP